MRVPTFPFKARRPTRGFTLIELLTVVVVIGILAALAVPALSSMRGRANESVSAGNLRNMGVAMALYAQDNNNRLPAVLDEDNAVWFIKLTPYLQEQTHNSAKLTDIYRCPAYTQLPGYGEKSDSDWTQLGYGMSYVMVGSPYTGWPWGPAGATAYSAPLATIEDPSNTVLLAEHDSWNWGLHASNFSGNRPQYETPQRAHRHGNRANYLFVDGRVESLTLDALEPYLAGN